MPNWSIHHGDCIPHMAADMEPKSIDMAVFSPPFPSMYAYTSSESDLGNTDTVGAEAKIHLGFFYRAIARVMKPGRVVCVHVCQIPRMKRSGGVGLCDYRGINIRLGERAGLTYEYDWLITKNPQAQAIRTRARELQFAGLESDRARQRGTIGDYIIKFTAPGANAVPITDVIDTDLVMPGDDGDGRQLRIKPASPQVTRNQWIDWAEAAWTNIRETHTLNVVGTKGENDTKHICPLQLDVIERCIRLYSNPGETVFSPFTGIGSEGYMALKLGRNFYGCELKDEYYATAKKNLANAEKSAVSGNQRSLFAMEDEVVHAG